MVKLFILIFSVVVVVTACKYTCEEFPAFYLKWVPFEIGNSIQYTNGYDTLVFEVVDNYRNGETSTRGLWMDYWCSYEAYYETNKVQNFKLIEHYGFDYRGVFAVAFSDTDSFYFFLSQSNAQTDSLSVVFTADTTINNVKYSEVYTVHKDTTTLDPKISWFVKAANEGVVQFYDRRNNERWTKLN